MPPRLERVRRASLQCRTAKLGGHLYVCDHCGVTVERFNSCRNRHCPKCQVLDKARWFADRQEELLPGTYFYLVFTLPDDLLNPLVLRNGQPLYNLLLRKAADALLRIAADPRHLGARVGFLAVLHTWGQKLQLHPHLHCIAPGGGIAVDGDRWISDRKDFFLPIKVLARLFRRSFLAEARKLLEHQELDLPENFRASKARREWLDRLYATEWNVYCKPPFGGSRQALGYLARYTHRVAIANHWLLGIDRDEVVFRFKDYADEGAPRSPGSRPPSSFAAS